MRPGERSDGELLSTVNVNGPTHRTKTDLALGVLREQIRSGQLQPGDRMQVAQLSVNLGMSPTPIREALRLLQADRLVHYEPHHGVVVAEFESDQLADVYKMRLALEPMATQFAIERMSQAQVAIIDGIHDKLIAPNQVGRGGRLAKLNADWHWAIYSSADSASLNDFIRRLWDVFPWRTSWALDRRSAESVLEHETVMAAVHAHDAAAGAEAMRLHIQAGRDERMTRHRAVSAAHSDGRPNEVAIHRG